MSEPTIEQQIEALAILRNFRKTDEAYANSTTEDVVEAINTLDNADLFADLDEASLEREAEASRINVTIREVPGGWIALQDDDRSKVIAETVLYADLEIRLGMHSVPVYIEKVISGDDEEDEDVYCNDTSAPLPEPPCALENPCPIHPDEPDDAGCGEEADAARMMASFRGVELTGALALERNIPHDRTRLEN